MEELIIHLIRIVVVFGAVTLTVALLSLTERRVSGFIQDRRGPNRVGPHGLLQPVADGIKFFMKEDIVPADADRVLFILSVAILAIPSLVTYAVIPFGDHLPILGRSIRLQIADLNVGVLYILAFSSLTVYGIVLGGWSSRSKYPLLGGLRSSAQLISYEIPLGLSLIPVLMVAESLRLPEVVAHQTGSLWIGLPAWNIFIQPLAFIIFAVSLFAELNRLPFDLPETEQELVGGYLTEYSSMKFAFFMLGEYFNLVTGSMLMVTLFFGGWHVPGLRGLELAPLWTSLVEVGAFVVKTGAVLFTFQWVRWTLPRFRFDQLMGLGWKVLIPLALANIAATGAWILWRG